MLRICGDCTTAYAADLDKCPHCGSADFYWNHEPAAAEVVKPVKAGKSAARDA